MLLFVRTLGQLLFPAIISVITCFAYFLSPVVLRSERAHHRARRGSLLRLIIGVVRANLYLGLSLLVVECKGRLWLNLRQAIGTLHDLRPNDIVLPFTAAIHFRQGRQLVLAIA